MRPEVSETLGKLKTNETIIQRPFEILLVETKTFQLMKEAHNMHRDIAEFGTVYAESDIHDNTNKAKKTAPEWCSDIRFEVTDPDVRDTIIPPPFNKGAMNDLVGNIAVKYHIADGSPHYQIDGEMVNNQGIKNLQAVDAIVIEIKTFDTDPNRKSVTKNTKKKISQLESDLEQMNSVIYTLSSSGKISGKVDKKTALISETGLNNSKDAMLKHIAQGVQDALDVKSVTELTPDIRLLDESITDTDYINEIIFGIHPIETDYGFINRLFSSLKNKVVYGSLYDFLNTQLNIKYKTKIGERRMKSLFGYILESNYQNLDLSALLKSEIPENLIISRDTPHMNFERVKLKPMTDDK